MTRILICALGLGALVGSFPLAEAGDPGIALPPVPRALLLAANETRATIRHVSAESTDKVPSDVGAAPAATLSLGPKTIRVSPGTTAISLTLAPRHIPPREVRLVLTGVVVRAAAPTVKPRRLRARSDQPYVEHIAAAFRALAQNRVPAGYRLRKAGRKERVACRQPGLSVTTAQVLEGRGLRILAARARDQGKQSVDLEEQRCSADAGSVVAAVAAWPRSRLAPGEETELYLALRPRESAHERGERPSLLGGRR